jgi:hypothetical protein
MKIFWLVLVAMVPLTWGQTPNDIERVKLAYARLSFATQTFAVDDALSAEPNISYERLVKAVAARTVTFSSPSAPDNNIIILLPRRNRRADSPARGFTAGCE